MAICVMSGWTWTQTRYRPTCFDFRSRPVRRRLRARLPALSPEDSDSVSVDASSFGAAASSRLSGTTGASALACGGAATAGAGLVSPIFGFGLGAARGPSGGLELLLPPVGSGG